MDDNQQTLAKPVRAYTSNFGQMPTYGAFQPPFGGDMYPGLGGGGGNLPTLYNQQSSPGGGLGSLLGGASSGGSGGGSINFSQIKTFVDRMGGIDGIVGTMGKMQKIFQSVQQMAPMMKLLMSSFLKRGGSATTTGRGDRLGRWPSTRRSSRRRRPLSTRRRTSGLRPRTRVRYSRPRRRR